MASASAVIAQPAREKARNSANSRTSSNAAGTRLLRSPRVRISRKVRAIGSTRKGAEDVGVLEGTHDPAVAQEQVAAGNDVEIAADARERREHGGGDVSLR